MATIPFSPCRSAGA